MSNFILPPSHSTSISPEINASQKQSNTFFKFIKKLVSDLKSTCWPTQTHQPVADPTEFIHEKTPKFKSFSESISTATNKVVSSSQNLTEHTDSKSNATSKENDTDMSDIAKNSVKNSESEVSIDAFSDGFSDGDVTIPENIDMIAARIDEYSNPLQDIIDEKNQSSFHH